MRRLWAIGFWLWVCAASLSAEQYVLPGRADLDAYHFDKTSLPYSTWTNTAQWLVDSSRVDFSPDHAGVPSVVDAACLAFGGVDERVNAAITGLGDGDFYYRFGFIYDYKENTYLFCDGDALTSNRWLAFHYVDNNLSFIIDGSGTKTTYPILLDAEVSDGDVIDVIASRTGSTVTISVENITTGLAYPDSATNADDFSGGSSLVIGCVQTTAGVYSQYSTFKSYLFEAGTTSSNIIRRYDFEEFSGTTAYDSTENGNDGTISGATWTTAGGISCAGLKDGFGKEVQVLQDTEMVDPDAWDEDPNWTVGGGEIACGGSGTTFLEQVITPSIALVTGNTYRLTISFSGAGGSLYISSGGFGTVSGVIGSTATDKVVDLLCLNATKPFRLASINWVGIITSIKLELLGVLVPADASDPTKDVLGNPLTNPPGSVHNGAACSLVLADGSTNTYAQLLALSGTKTNANGAITSLYLTN